MRRETQTPGSQETKLSPHTLDLPRKKAQFPWPGAQSKPITSSGGLQISPVLLTRPSRALLEMEGPSLPSLPESTGLRLCDLLKPRNGQWRKQTEKAPEALRERR